MLIDKRSSFATATALSTAGTGRAVVGDQIDLGNVGAGTIAATSTGPGDILGGSNREGLAAVIVVTTSVTSAGAATVSFEVVSDSVAPPATDGTATLHAKSADIPKATLVAGYTVKLPLGPQTYERYLGLLQNVGTAALTAGAVTAFLARDVGSWVAYPDAVIG